MVKKIILSIIVALLFAHVNTSFAIGKKSYDCGLSDGYPPYQFKNKKGEIKGFDAEVIRLIFHKAEKEIVFHQMNWDDVVGMLWFTDKLDCAGGMEINEARKKLFDFTSPFYSRKIAVFIHSDETIIKKLEDLEGKKITGDRHSSIEKLLNETGIKTKIRIKKAKSKEDSMRLLKTREFSAMIAPKEVGLYLAKQLNVSVKILVESEEESPVAIAVKKGDLQLLNLLDNALQELIKEGEIQKLYQDWFK